MAANDTAHAYAAETQIAIAAVRRACVLTASVFNKLVKQETLTTRIKGSSIGQNRETEAVEVYRSRHQDL